ncbi:MAG: flagellar hook-basal body complex protein FliE [Sphingomonadales bacterium]|nr:flagellar hook-basal body complex protein FliE [Sphingomonadales bacterium]
MDSKIMQAVNAYGKTMQQGAGLSTDSAKNAGGLSFKDVLGDAAVKGVDAAAKAEQATAMAVTGQADLVDVVTAVTNAEVVVESVVAVRDRVISAYNDIIKMPI